MLVHPGNFIGDVWFYPEEDKVHAYYLTVPSSVPRYSTWSIAHAVSRDLREWDLRGIVLQPGPEGSWDESGLATGCVFRDGLRYYLAYTGRHHAQTGLAVSDNLYQWSKCPHNPATQLDAVWYEEIGSGLRKMRHWRDPFVLRHDGRWYQLTCASDRHAPEGARGTVGLACSEDLMSWAILPPLEVEPICQEMECPQLLEREGCWYLVFSALADQITPEACQRIGRENVWWTTYVMMAECFEGPYRLAARPRIIPSGWKEQPYACQIVQYQGKDYCLGSVWPGLNADCPEVAPDYVCDPIPISFSSEGILVS